MFHQILSMVLSTNYANAIEMKLINGNTTSLMTKRVNPLSDTRITSQIGVMA